MAMIAKSEKLPGGPEQFYFMAGGYVLLRIARDGGERQFSVMTATADEAKPYIPPVERPEPKAIFGVTGDSPSRGKARSKPRQEAVHPKAYPDLAKLIEAARQVPGLGGGVEGKDKWHRPYLVARGHQDAARVRSLGNDLARALGLETYDEQWVYEELQAIHEEF